MYYLPTLEECKKIAANNNVFREYSEVINGCKCIGFDNKLALNKDFLEQGALELRGITFVEDKLSGEYKRFLHLHKFFNSHEEYSLNNIDYNKNKIISSQNKIDGSMVVPNLVDDKIHFKTRGGFSSDQAKIAQQLVESNINIYRYIYNKLKLDLIPIFELISPYNVIVIDYNKTDLVLLQIRNNKTGEYIENIEDYTDGIVSCSKRLEILKFQDYIELAKTETDKEGWVLKFDNSQFVKIKTEWYLSLHGLLTENLVKEDRIISMILNGTIDDALSNLKQDDFRREYISSIQMAINNYITYVYNEIRLIYSDFLAHRPIKKDFVLVYKSHKLFHYIMSLYIEADETNKIPEYDSIFKVISVDLLKKTYRYESAKTWLRNIGFKHDRLNKVIAFDE